MMSASGNSSLDVSEQRVTQDQEVVEGSGRAGAQIHAEGRAFELF